MFDIDKELNDIKTEKYMLSDTLRQDTRKKIRKEIQNSARKTNTAPKFALKVCSAVAVAMALILLLSIKFTGSAQAAGYYTIDINPSISVAVDENNIVLSVSPENGDAADLLSGVDLIGISFNDALKIIIQCAVEKSYLKDNGNLLVAYFGSDEGISQQELSMIVSEQVPDNKINVLLLSSGKDDFENAKKSGNKAGIELLMNDAKDMGIEDEDVGTVIRIMSVKDGGNPGNGVPDQNSGNANANNKDNGNKGNNGNSGNSNGNNNKGNDKSGSAGGQDDKETGNKNGGGNNQKDDK